LRQALAAAPAAQNKAMAEVQQHNTLIAIVDDLQAEQPALIGAWLAARVGNDVNLMPIYPQPLQSEGGYAQAHEALRMAGSEIADLATLDPIRDANVRFDAAFILDEAAASAIGVLAGAPGAGLTESWQQPQAALQEQISLLKTVCTAHWGEPAGLNGLLALMPDHMRTTLTAFDIITAWDSWAAAGSQLACSHPWAE
jgi:hypothetical protein